MTFDIRPSIADLSPNQIREVAEIGFAMPDVIPLWFGESDRPTAEFIKQAACKALDENHVFYLPNNGLPTLREAIQEYSQRTYGMAVSAPQITVTASGMQAIMLTMQALVDPGDEVVVVTPVWPNAAGAVRVMGGVPREVPLRETEAGWRLGLQELFGAVNDKTKAVYLNSPNNPTGWMIDDEEGARLLEFCREKKKWLICDDVYSRIVYERNHAPLLIEAAGPEDRVISIHSFSKTWSMTGWRLGWIIAPPHLERTFAMLNEFNIAGPTSFVQYAGIAALRDGEEEFAEMLVDLRESRDYILEALGELPGVRIKKPSGAFYAFFAVANTDDSLEFAKRILRETGVGLAPGSAFGAGGEGFLRLCFANKRETLGQAIDRLSTFFSRM